ncbi:MAG: hypothetical protein ABJM06_11690 [Gilvibacter sp.]
MKSSKNSYYVALAHSDKSVSDKLAGQLYEQGIFIDSIFTEGIRTLGLLVSSAVEVLIIEASLPVLSAQDIILMASQKGIKTKFIIVTSPDQNIMLPPWITSKYIVITSDKILDRLSEIIPTRMSS